MPLLELRQVSKRFLGTQALRNVDFSVEPGEVHALMGENGAGKSTLAKIIAGVTTPDSGELRWNGEIVTIGSPLRAQALGIGIIFQELDLFPHLTIAENMAIGNSAAQENFIVRSRELHSWCSGFLDQIRLKANPGTLLRHLSIGEVQLVAIARALSMNARLLLMDEPTSSLTEDSVEALYELISQLVRKGVSIVYVSHKMAEVFRISSRITVLRDGSYLGTRATSELSMDNLISMMVGRTLEQRERMRRETSPETILDVRGLKTDFLSGIQFQLGAGEVLGVAGLVGAGRSELGAALFGLKHRLTEDIELAGKPFVPRTPAEAIRQGFCLVPEDRKGEGIFPQMPVLENATLGVLDRLHPFGLLKRERDLNAVETFRRKLAFPAFPDIPISALSGGNQQKILIARWLMADPKVFFLDEPTRGIDIGAKEQIYRMIDDLASEGKGIILVSSELPELFRCCDRILVLHEGKQMALLHSGQTTQEEILAFATGIT